ncbi:hypothetical protein BDR03DRAFT_91961 [Suillus americanus]|nr:hypothetical protein BDR03DRAFT_91961 [Suillus americanus]
MPIYPPFDDTVAEYTYSMHDVAPRVPSTAHVAAASTASAPVPVPRPAGESISGPILYTPCTKVMPMMASRRQHNQIQLYLSMFLLSTVFEFYRHSVTCHLLCYCCS